MRNKKRLVIERLASQELGFGDAAPDRWEEYTTATTTLLPLSGRELYIAEQAQSQVTHTARCKYVPGVTSAMRMRLGERLFNISSVVNERERNKFLVLKLIENTDG